MAAVQADAGDLAGLYLKPLLKVQDGLRRVLRIGQPLPLEHVEGGLAVVELVTAQVEGVEPPPERPRAHAAGGEQPDVPGAHPSGQSRSSTWSMQASRAETSSGSTAGKVAMRSWLRPSLR